jgi:putative ribosome biogenesis GTPase RsgA
MKLEGITSTNPVAVGDIVEMESQADTDNSAIIDEIHPRHNYINRQSPGTSTSTILWQLILINPCWWPL